MMSIFLKKSVIIIKIWMVQNLSVHAVKYGMHQLMDLGYFLGVAGFLFAWFYDTHLWPADVIIKMPYRDG